MFKNYKIFLIIIPILACHGMIVFFLNIENTLGIQSRRPDMDFYEMHNGLYYYTSFEKGFFTYNPDTKEIKKLSDDKAAATSIYFQDGYVFFRRYRGSSIIRMDEDGQNRIIVAKNCYKYRVYNQKIYFINKDNQKLYSSNLDGDDIKVKIDRKFSGLRIEKGWLYLIGYNKQNDMKLHFDTDRIEIIWK